MPPFAVSALLAGRVIAAGLACGLNLYATIALIGLGSRLGWFELPPALLGLGQWLLIGGALALFAIESILAALPIAGPLWEAAHTVIRPLGAGSLTVTALEGLPWSLRLAAGLLAATAALAAHSAKVGLRLVIIRRRAERIAVGAAESVAATLLILFALAWPTVALAAVVASAAALAIVGPRLWRATAFAALASRAAVRGFFGSRRWLAVHELPTAVRQRVPPAELGLPDPRATRAALGSQAAGPWRNGWLVLDGRSASFLYRRAFRTHEIRLPHPHDPGVRHDLLADVIIWTHDGQPFELHLLRDGPSAEITVGALQLTVR